MFSFKKGFTLIELLVVVAIIGILATVVLASLGQARARAREKKFIAAVSSLRTALEAFHLDQGTYPSSFEYYPGENYEGGRSVFTEQMLPYFDTDSLIEAVPAGVTQFIYYGVRTTEPNGGSAELCPGQLDAAPGQTYAITFVTQGTAGIADPWQHDTQGDFDFYCLHS